MFCHNCGVSCPQYAKFCHHCGTKLINEAPTAYPAATAAPSETVITPEVNAPAAPVQAVSTQAPVEKPVLSQPVAAEMASEHPAEPIPFVPAEAPTQIPSAPISAQSFPPQSIPQYHIYQPVQAAPQANPYLPQQSAPVCTGKKGTHWIPIVIMVILSLIGFGLFIGIPSIAAPESDTPWFQNVDGVLYFDESLYDGSGELEVPAYVDGEPVTSLGKKCFAGCDTLTSVILPDTLQTIDDRAFANCPSLRGIFIPEQVTYIGTDAFFKCTALEAVSIPGSVNEIKSGAFYGCSSLKYIMYDDTHLAWMNLYSDFIAPETEVHCTDGTYPHWSSNP